MTVAVLILLCVGWAMAIALAPSVIRANLPSDSRRERALGMAGRLALPAPDDEHRDDPPWARDVPAPRPPARRLC